MATPPAGPADLTDAAGFPLTVQAFAGNKAETATMLPVITAFKKTHQISDITVVADAGMISEANQIAIAAAGLTYVLGARLPFLPDIETSAIQVRNVYIPPRQHRRHCECQQFRSFRISQTG